MGVGTRLALECDFQLLGHGRRSTASSGFRQ
jgi:hypothetical protein